MVSMVAVVEYWVKHEKAMSTSVLCRLCLFSMERKYCKALFTDRNTLHERVSELLCVPVVKWDGFPEYICRACKRAVERVEQELKELKQRIRESYKRHSSEQIAIGEVHTGYLCSASTRKRSKTTSSIEAHRQALLPRKHRWNAQLFQDESSFLLSKRLFQV